MPHNREKLIVDLQLACDDIVQFCGGRTYEAFSGDRLLQAGVERKLEIVGEALTRLCQIDPKWLEDSIPEYRRIIGLRNVIAHGYDVVDYDILWDVAKNHVPALRETLEFLP
ncbi:MAG: DUF86 domain-containing protein [Verrucomicrobiota bacterium]